MRLADFVVPIVGNNLFQLRRAARLTRPALAARCALLPRRCVSPLSVAALTHLERGRRRSITSDEVATLAKALHVPASTLTKATKVVAPFAPLPSPTAEQRAARNAKRRRTPKPQLIRDKDVGRALCISDATKWRWRRAGDFPQPIRLGDNTVAYDMNELRDWLASRRVPRREAAAAM